MGNGSVKPKQSKQPDGTVNRSINTNGNRLFKDSGPSLNIKNTADILRLKVLDLEKETKRKDDELWDKDFKIKGLQDQLAKQTKTISELTEELQNKCIQLNKLQDVIITQSGGSLHPSPIKAAARINQQVSSLIKDTFNRRKGAKEGVSAEPTSRTYDTSKLPEFSFEKVRVHKDSNVKKLVLEALNKNQFLKRLDPQQIRDMVECMYERSYHKGDHVIKQGEPGNHLFVLAEGNLDVYQHNKLITSITVWTAFGELAVLYNCKRTASVRAVSDVKTWALDREVFQNIMRKTAQARHEQYRNFLRSVNLITHLPEDKLSKIVDCLEVEYYDTGDYIIREGEEGSTFYIIAKGKVKVTQRAGSFNDPKLIKTLQKGDYFGEKALISDDVRSASIIADENDVECLVIDRETFNQTVGTFDELQKYLQGYVATLSREDEQRLAKASSCDRWSPAVSLEMIQLKDKVSGFSSTSPFQNLEIIATLGVGGFGRVELVKVKNEDVTFAMKCIKKKHIVDNRQEEHIHSERKILEEACSPFVVKLYRTFKDSKYVYMLLEACLGGEIWSLLRDRGSFDEQTAKFCVTCVTEAFDYLHQIGVVYRDLKPENLMLDSAGYIKLVDFGFAKKIDWGQKTWTFCGTPEYVAPEIILNKGHDFSVDFWSLGILVFELLTGNPPFSGVDQMMIYNLILKGIEKMDFPKRITRRPEDLIRRLCKQNSTERLGNLKNGINDIKKHRWFNGFNWEGLKARNLLSPLKRELQGPTDHSYFDNYPPDEDIPPDELSGWDNDF
ncbi:KGP2 kinase, partial [Polypterus senegalus]|nr:cGMP-dependent protein kinase 2 isoform X1 [Polypterus senegalus]XP_039613957.1 cGMP-dependent protein kinase 2 isoform X1 [Polypterus senegalus]MBN3292837.1 KGP2 kinase [Polypterus senegalus]